MSLILSPLHDKGRRGLCWSFLSGAREWLKASSREVQAGCQGNILPWEGDLAVQGAQGSGTKPDGVQGALGRHSLIYRLIFKLPCVKSGVGLDDPQGPLPAQDILCSWVHFESNRHFTQKELRCAAEFVVVDSKITYLHINPSFWDIKEQEMAPQHSLQLCHLSLHW